MTQATLEPSTIGCPPDGRIAPSPALHIRRFDGPTRALHIVIMGTFLGLSATGLPLLFSDASWSRVLAGLFGGFHGAGLVHRFFGATLLLAVVWHVANVCWRAFVRGERGLFWGPTSMVPQPRDVVQLFEQIRWFVGAGPRPRFEHFAYWEKFDYWAVFWGMAIIGGSGLLLWFPVTFSRIVPGWVYNIALLVHGEEALLAVGFIFTIHFFNGHLRPDKFPMDMVIFTGRVSEHDLKEERPAEYARAAAAGRLADAGPPSRRAWLIGRLIGTTAVIVGLSLVALILYAVAAQP